MDFRIPAEERDGLALGDVRPGPRVRNAPAVGVDRRLESLSVGDLLLHLDNLRLQERHGLAAGGLVGGDQTEPRLIRAESERPAERDPLRHLLCRHVRLNDRVRLAGLDRHAGRRTGDGA